MEKSSKEKVHAIFKPDVWSIFLVSFVKVSPIFICLLFVIAFWVAVGLAFQVLPVLLIIVLIMLGMCLGIGLNLLNFYVTEYRLVSDGVHFYEGFFTRREKFIPWNKVTDVHLTEVWPWNVWTRTGTVVLESAGSISKLQFYFIKNHKEAYGLLKTLLKKSR